MRACQIVAALRVKAADAQKELFDAYGEELIAYCWQLLRGYDATLIAVRDTMIAAQAHARRLRDPELLGPWLLALARVECERRAPVAARGAKGEAAGPYPAPEEMRDEILACLTDPRQARYRAVAAARIPPLHLDGFPRVNATAPRWRPRWRGLRVTSVFLPVGAAASAGVILLAAGLSLQGGGSSDAAPAASASPLAAARAAPALADSASPQAGPVATTRVAPLSTGPIPRGHSIVGPTEQALFDVASQQGQSAGPAGPAATVGGGQSAPLTPPTPAGMPPVLLPSHGAPPADLSAVPDGRPSVPWWRRTGLPLPRSQPAGQPATLPSPAARLAGSASPITPVPNTPVMTPTATPTHTSPPRPAHRRRADVPASGSAGDTDSSSPPDWPDWPGWPTAGVTAQACPPAAWIRWWLWRHHGLVRDDLAYRYESCTITPRIISPSSRSW